MERIGLHIGFFISNPQGEGGVKCPYVHMSENWFPFFNFGLPQPNVMKIILNAYYHTTPITDFGWLHFYHSGVLSHYNVTCKLVIICVTWTHSLFIFTCFIPSLTYDASFKGFKIVFIKVTKLHLKALKIDSILYLLIM